MESGSRWHMTTRGDRVRDSSTPSPESKVGIADAALWPPRSRRRAGFPAIEIRWGGAVPRLGARRAAAGCPTALSNIRERRASRIRQGADQQLIEDEAGGEDVGCGRLVTPKTLGRHVENRPPGPDDLEQVGRLGAARPKSPTRTCHPPRSVDASRRMLPGFTSRCTKPVAPIRCACPRACATCQPQFKRRRRGADPPSDSDSRLVQRSRRGAYSMVMYG